MSATVDIGTLIVSTPRICGSCPRIAGTRIFVQQIAVLMKEGLIVDEIINQYEF